MKIQQIAVVDLEIGDMFVDADTDESYTDDELTADYDMEALAEQAVTFVAGSAFTRMTVRDHEGTERTVPVSWAFQIVWRLVP